MDVVELSMPAHPRGSERSSCTSHVPGRERELLLTHYPGCQCLAFSVIRLRPDRQIAVETLHRSIEAYERYWHRAQIVMLLC